MDIFTDLAMESSKYIESDKAKYNISDKLSRIVIDKGYGNKYITYESYDNLIEEKNAREELSNHMAHSLSELMELKRIRKNKILVIGLGNRGMTADALGTRVVDRLIIDNKSNISLCAFAPSVTGLTGIETYDIVKGISDRVEPTMIIAIDTLASRKVSRINSAYQMSDSGIRPGSGVGNMRVAINQETMGVRVIAMGVPLVVYAKTLAQDVLSDYINEPEKYQLNGSAVESIKRALDYKPSDLVVTPKEIDIIVDISSKIISEAINKSIWGDL